MKRITTLTSVLISALLFINGCKKEPGPAGPAGTNGKDGNANVVEFIYGPDSIQAGFFLVRAMAFPYSRIDSSLTLVYYQPSGSGLWYQSPGLGNANNYQTRYFTEIGGYYTYSPDSTTFWMTAVFPDGSNTYDQTINLDKLKIIIATASSVLSGKKESVDFSDYKATMKYFGLKE